MSKSAFYLTTAIDYTNASPHIGHAYEKLLADVIARYARAQGREVFFLTGVDQHGQKVQQSAEREGVDPKTFAEANTARFLALWDRMDIRFDGWAATTHPLHQRAVRYVLQRLHDSGQLYKASHRGFYSLRQEQFITVKERREDGSFGPEWGEVVDLEEENWYFRLSDHFPWLESFLESHPGFVFPEFRLREVLNAIHSAGAGDLCISRPKSRLSWGIDLPFDPEFVTYVWFDALLNYISFAGYLRKVAESGDPDGVLPDFDKLWPADIHLIGKDIMIPAHAVYWPIMLHALGFSDDEMPRLVVHGFWNDRRGHKVSKSEGNAIDPATRIDRFGTDGLRYYLMASIATGQDAGFNDDRVLELYNQDLANGLGNLLSRSLNMSGRYRQGVISVSAAYDDDLSRALRHAFLDLAGDVALHMKTHQVHLALEEIWKRVTLCNQYVEHCAPWKLAKDPASAPRLDAVLRHLVEALAHIAVHIAPVMPSTSREILRQLDLELPNPFPLSNLRWGLVPDRHQLGAPHPLFPRLA
ncbi:MAG TPA: class I tRNA ligase family protein [Verrucomicrobiales bacterium]|nr:class I tRNA ligase family protein [Verrucomicrobiales bacterium]